MYYLIDGYNFLFRIKSPKGKSLEQRRESLIHLLSEELFPLKGKVAVIFDSSEQMRDFPQWGLSKNLEVIYAPRGSSADTYIIELAEQTKNPDTLTIVTSDQGLAKQCRQIGTKTLSIEDFLAFVAKKKQKKGAGKPNYKESQKELERLRKIFEERLSDD